MFMLLHVTAVRSAPNSLMSRRATSGDIGPPPSAALSQLSYQVLLAVFLASPRQEPPRSWKLAGGRNSVGAWSVGQVLLVRV